MFDWKKGKSASKLETHFLNVSSFLETCLMLLKGVYIYTYYNLFPFK